MMRLEHVVGLAPFGTDDRHGIFYHEWDAVNRRTFKGKIQVSHIMRQINQCHSIGPIVRIGGGFSGEMTRT